MLSCYSAANSVHSCMTFIKSLRLDLIPHPQQDATGGPIMPLWQLINLYCWGIRLSKTTDSVLSRTRHNCCYPAYKKKRYIFKWMFMHHFSLISLTRQLCVRRYFISQRDGLWLDKTIYFGTIVVAIVMPVKHLAILSKLDALHIYYREPPLRNSMTHSDAAVPASSSPPWGKPLGGTIWILCFSILNDSLLEDEY